MRPAGPRRGGPAGRHGHVHCECSIARHHLWYWKFTNLLIHLLAGSLVFLLTFQLGRQVCGQDDALVRGWFALLPGCEWLLDAGDIGTARAWYADAQPVVAASRFDFSTYTQAIEARLGPAPD